MVGFQNLPYVGQDTNAAIESYHGTLKAQLKSGKSRLIGCCVDWCIHELVGDVLTHYWYQNLCKIFRFMNNKHQQLFVVGALLGAWLILDTNVTLPSYYDGGPTHIMSSKKPICCTPSTTQHQSGHVVTMSMHNVKTFASINSRF
jgi:hypothetical protein